jgi:diadenosine tetraphosphatase ApaH/serine/threonine PP2A family protein phosphatase
LLALLYDVHGNLPALDAVIDDARAAGAEGYLLGGDYAMAGALPAETVRRLEGLEAEWLRGNTERWVAVADERPEDPFIRAVCEYAHAELGESQATRLNGLSETIRMGEVLFCHASPRSDMETFQPAPAAEDEQLLSGIAQRVIVFGHSHLQFMREADGHALVNPGSVGMPLDGDPRAAYALWEKGSFELRRVTYDVERYVNEVRTRMSGMLGPHVDTVARRIERGAP